MEEREDQDGQDKTEDPSEDQRRKYREEGNVPAIKDVTAAIVISVIFAWLWIMGNDLVEKIKTLFEKTWSDLRPLQQGSADDFYVHVLRSLLPLIPNIVSLVAPLVLLPLSIGLLLNRFNWTLKPITPNFSKLNPVSGVQRVFGKQGFIELGKGLIKSSIFGFAVYLIIKKQVYQSSLFMMSDIKVISIRWSELALKLITVAVITSMIVSVLDYAFNWWRMEQQMKMSLRDIKQEMKSQEGDPVYKGHRRRMMRELVMRKSIKDSERATFVVTNPQHFAVAIRYVKGMTAPIVVAKGQDFLALKIKEIAKKKDIAIVENKPLARALYKTLKIGQEVPPSLYAAVIEVMKYIHQVRGKDYFDKRELPDAQPAGLFT